MPITYNIETDVRYQQEIEKGIEKEAEKQRKLLLPYCGLGYFLTNRLPQRLTLR